MGEMKRCSRGDECVHPDGPWLPASEFHVSNAKKTGRVSQCKACKSEYANRYREANREKLKERGRQRYHANAEKFRALRRTYYDQHSEEERAKRREYYRQNRDKALDYNRRWRRQNLELARELSRRYYQTDHGRLIGRLNALKRRAQNGQIRGNISVDDWQRALDYFGNSCAVCGLPFNDTGCERKPAADHWIPLSKGGATTPDNIVPLCHGKGGCNNHKRNKDPVEWLVGRYGRKVATEILDRINAYFETLRE